MKKPKKEKAIDRLVFTSVEELKDFFKLVLGLTNPEEKK